MKSSVIGVQGGYLPGRRRQSPRQVLPEAELSSNPTRQLVHLTLPIEVPLGSVLEAVEAAGYTPTPTAAQQHEDGWRELKRDHLKRIGVAGIAMMQVMMVSLAMPA